MKRRINLPFGLQPRLWHLLLVGLILLAAICSTVLYQQRQQNLDLLRRIERRGVQGGSVAVVKAVPLRCLGLNRDGSQCRNAEWSVLKNGYCRTHQWQAK